MTCPYCSGEMNKGKICVQGRGLPYWHWLNEGEKRRIEDAFTGKGMLSPQNGSIWNKNYFEGWHCPKCKKIILDADIQMC